MVVCDTQPPDLSSGRHTKPSDTDASPRGQLSSLPRWPQAQMSQASRHAQEATNQGNEEAPKLATVSPSSDDEPAVSARQPANSWPSLEGKRNGDEVGVAEPETETEAKSESVESVEEQHGQRRQMGKFVLESAEDLLIFASSYQNEVYLPCRIANLDEEQTVSRSPQTVSACR